MRFVIRLVSLACGRASDLEGMWVREFDPEFADGVGMVIGTPDPREAMTFGSVADAWLTFRKVSVTRPHREDGEPNRPLTAFNIECHSVEAAFDIAREGA